MTSSRYPWLTCLNTHPTVTSQVIPHGKSQQTQPMRTCFPIVQYNGRICSNDYRGFQVGCPIPSSHITHAHTDWPTNEPYSSQASVPLFTTFIFERVLVKYERKKCCTYYLRLHGSFVGQSVCACVICELGIGQPT